MTKKQMKKFVDEISKYELIRQNPSSTKEEVAHAEDKIMQIVSKIMAEDEVEGISNMLAIDEEVSKKLNANK